MVDIYSSHSKHPSFSSTLLDAIYRSIDQGNEEKTVPSGEITRREKELHDQLCNSKMVEGGVLIQKKEESASFQRDFSIEKRVLNGKVAVREKSATVEENYSSSSWDSSCGGGGVGASGGSGLCSSFDGDAFYGKRLKPIRVWDSGKEKDKKSINFHEKPIKNQEGLSKKNSRALKMCAGLKKVKQPISPGAARLASFLNSLFSSTGKYSKKPTINYPDNINSPTLKSANSSTCSSASSLSRSCLSKTPSCRGQPNGGEKRSVRFSPVSVILNQNSQSCGNKSSPKAIKNKNQKLETFKNITTNSIISAHNLDEQMLLHAKEMNKKVEEAARDLLRNYQNCEFLSDFKKSQISNQLFNQEFDEESEEDDDDAASCASSDLFELDNLSAIGAERFELPVYETTRLPANGLIM